MIGAALSALGETVGAVLFVAVIAAVVIADHYLPDSADEELRRFYRGQWKRRRRRGHTR